MNLTRLGSLNAAEAAAWASVVVTFIGILAAAAGIWWQLRKQWKLHSATLIASLDERFHSPEFRHHRAVGQRRLLYHDTKKTPPDLSDDLPVLGFFENMAYLVHKGALHKGMVWNKFGWYVVGYYLTLTRWKNKNGNNSIEQYRIDESDPTLYEEFAWLYFECIEIYHRKKVPTYNCCWQRKRIDNLLKNEGALQTVPLNAGTSPGGRTYAVSANRL